MKSLLSFLVIFVSLLLISCGGDDGVEECSAASFNFSQEISDELNAFVAAANAWSQDPTNSSKCNAYKNAAQDYIDAARSLEDCAREAGQLTQFNEGLNEAEVAFNSISC